MLNLKIEDSMYIKRTIRIFVISLIIIIISFTLTMIFSPSVETFKNLGSNTSKSITEASGLNKVWEFIVNNAIKVPVQMLFIAILPIPYLYFANFIITSVLTGFMFGFALHIDFNKGSVIVLSSMPHTIFEILALCFFISGLYKFNKSIIRKISNLFRKKKRIDISIKLAFINLFKIYILIALPLFIIAAFLETYLVNYLYNLFT